MITISLCMIVKNEEATLARCLDSVADLMDEIIIIDTGSTDATKEIAARYTSNIYDYQWINDFSDARNFSFSKATMDYIYAPDADEVLDEENRERFLNMKKCLLPEIDIVQMKYVTITDFNTVLNAQKEYRPKLFKRLRPFTWVDPIHETVRLEPVVYDSDIDILHMPTASHGKRDFGIFLETFEKNQHLSEKLRMMYEKELYKVGTLEDLMAAKPIFESIWQENATTDAGKEAACILARIARLEQDGNTLMKYALRDMLENPCAEICYELGCYYLDLKDYEEAIVWFYNAAYETASIIDIRTSGDLALEGLVKSYQGLLEPERCKNYSSEAYNNYKMLLEQYEDAYKNWELPVEL
ncbi:MAG: glycosyltransferase family 2 protein [Eubacteriales bacterium]|nr:glycosyltransferase family 2 protein [Eubacteriales bacterium]